MLNSSNVVKWIITLVLLLGLHSRLFSHSGQVERACSSLELGTHFIGDTVIDKNAIYVTAGIWVLATGCINYERALIRFGKKKGTLLAIKAGFGGWAEIEGFGKMFLLSPKFIFGKKSNHFELELGVAILEDSDEPYYLPDISTGYRYQKKGAPFIFRVGFGVPEGAYLSLGIAF